MSFSTGSHEVGEADHNLSIVYKGNTESERNETGNLGLSRLSITQIICQKLQVNCILIIFKHKIVSTL